MRRYLMFLGFLVLAFSAFGQVPEQEHWSANPITIPLDGGTAVIQDARFIRLNDFGDFVPELSFAIVNRTLSWWSLKLQFDVSGSCGGGRREWSIPTTMTLVNNPTSVTHKDSVIPLFGKVDGCHSDSIAAKLVAAENANIRIDGATGERIDLTAKREAEQLAREAEIANRTERIRAAAQAQAEEEAAEAETERLAAEAEAKNAAVVAAKRKRLLAEQKKRDAEQHALNLKRIAALKAEIAIELQRARAVCAESYRNTSEKKLKDLTVKEADQIRRCQSADMYPPR
jgi:anti-sigma28 factor (negative regulator of flagellin synthesis)